MMAVGTMAVQKAQPLPRPVSFRIQKWVAGLGPVISGPVLGIGLSLLGLVPMMFL